ncbi:MAG TPA: serine hydrolase domain-containing protein [Dehalococcoidia bacterium]|nr:serine hydrolase domain-containing protein [Dehalococcoidia bacterium]
MTEIHGVCDERFAAVREVMARNFEQGLDVGASVAVTLGGELVVDLWAGHADEARTTPWERDTITNVWSTTKTMTALSALLLADRGAIDLHAPVAHYWPEFAAAGKSAVEVRHLMGHTSGLSGWQEPITVETLYDWEKATALLAAQAPWWEPGSASGYHAISQGYLVGEVIRRVTGQTVGQFFAAELARPLGADFHIGLDPSQFGRIANVIPPPPLEVPNVDPNGVAMRTLANPPIDAAWSWTAPWRRAEIPAANGHGNARSVALVQAVLACGGEVGGRRFLSEKGCQTVFEQQAYGTDLVLGAPIRFGMGYGLNSPEMPIGANERVCFWGGWGGSLIVVDVDARLTVAYVMNRMGEGTLGDTRGAGVVAAAYASLAASAATA